MVINIQHQDDLTARCSDNSHDNAAASIVDMRPCYNGDDIEQLVPCCSQLNAKINSDFDSYIQNMRISLVRKMLGQINIVFGKQVNEILYQVISRSMLVDARVVQQLMLLRSDMRVCYHSSMLSCLHTNSIEKQRNPGICMVRQILKVNGMRLQPKQQSMGYDASTGKKNVHRYYIVMPA